MPWAVYLKGSPRGCHLFLGRSGYLYGLPEATRYVTREEASEAALAWRSRGGQRNTMTPVAIPEVPRES